jgi:hypothetical protein
MSNGIYIFFLVLLSMGGYASDPTPSSDRMPWEEPHVYLRSMFSAFPTVFPTCIEETQVFEDDDPIPFPRSYQPLVAILKKVQEPGLTFEEAKLLIEAQAGLISTLYKPKYGKNDPRLCRAFARILGSRSLQGAFEIGRTMDEILDEEIDKHPERMLFPVTWQFVMCYLKTFEIQMENLKKMPRSDSELAELAKHMDLQRREFMPISSAQITIYGLYHGIAAVFKTVLGYQKNAPSDFFSDSDVNYIFYVLGLSKENPCPPELTLATHKLLFMIYFNHLLVHLYDLFHAYMEGTPHENAYYNDSGEQLTYTFAEDYSRSFHEVCSRVWQKRGFSSNPKWNIFHHANKMIDHIIYVDDESLFSHITPADRK